VEATESHQVAPTAAELERAIASVPGVAEAAVRRDDASGRSRLRLRLAPGEDAAAVSWAVAATLRERFGIALDPDAIRPLPADAPAPADDGAAQRNGPAPHDAPAQRNGPAPHETPAHRNGPAPRPDAGSAAASEDPIRLVEELSPDTAAGEPTAAELAETRERLSAAASAASAALAAAEDVEAPVAAAAAVLIHASLDDHPDDDESVAASAAGPGARPADAAAPTEGDPVPARTSVPGDGRSRGRAVIRHLDTQRDEVDVRVTATLELGGSVGHGRAVTVPTTSGVFRAIAEATVAALRELTGEQLLAGIDRITLHPTSEPSMVTVVVTLLTDRGEETLLGGSIVRGDPDRAVMRATLDALNRRVARLLPSDPDPAAAI
jgi:hypothetical protein